LVENRGDTDSFFSLMPPEDWSSKGFAINRICLSPEIQESLNFSRHISKVKSQKEY
jgi:hypothetical protein